MSRSHHPGRRAVADLHCDLLAYLVVGEMQGLKRTPNDALSRASLPQMRQGGVALQTLAIFVTSRPGWSAIGHKQAEIYARLVETYDQDVRPVRSMADLAADERIGLVAAVENASAFADEDASMDEVLKGYERIRALTGPLLYVSLTWNGENRFGGGVPMDETTEAKGLKPDGKVLLDYLAEKGPAVDLSHTSPRLAHDILDYIYAKGLDLPVLASHSPYRSLVDIQRNLGDVEAKEIAARGGLIGLNLLGRFLKGEPPHCFVDQIRHAQELGVLGAQAMGADFFYEGDIPDRPADAGEEFHPGFADASCYPSLFSALQEELELDDAVLDDLAWNHFESFLPKVLPAT